MKKVLSLALALTIFGFTNAFSHAPSAIDAKFDKASSTLTLKIAHNITKSKVTDINKHFVSPVKISVNKAVIANLKFDKQDNGESKDLTYTFDKKLKKGDKIHILAVCNLKGTKELTITVE
jgi:desulfoferrodoxin (superoxide reductase-like protein)